MEQREDQEVWEADISELSFPLLAVAVLVALAGLVPGAFAAFFVAAALSVIVLAFAAIARRRAVDELGQSIAAHAASEPVVTPMAGRRASAA